LHAEVLVLEVQNPGLGNAEVTTNSASFGAGVSINYFVTDRIVLNFGLEIF
jgi:hypothetical protein